MEASGCLDPLEPTPQAILFDLDDTLCDYATAREIRLRVAFSLGTEEGATQRTEAELATMVEASIRMHPHGVEHFPDLFSQFGVADPAVAIAAARWYRANRLYGLQLFDDALPVLQAVKHTKVKDGIAIGRPIGIITNGPTDVQREKLKLLGLDGLVDFVLISEEFGAAKPDARIFDEAMRLANVDATDAVFIGDSPEFDMLGAIGKGMSTIWINRPRAPWSHFEPRPDREVSSIAEVPVLVGSA